MTSNENTGTVMTQLASDV